MSKKAKLLRLTACLLTVAMVISAIVTVCVLVAKVGDEAVSSFITKYEGSLKDLGLDISDYFDDAVVQPLPNTVKDDESISLIIKVNEDPLLDTFAKEDRDFPFLIM